MNFVNEKKINNKKILKLIVLLLNKFNNYIKRLIINCF